MSARYGGETEVVASPPKRHAAGVIAAVSGMLGVWRHGRDTLARNFEGGPYGGRDKKW